MLLALVFVAAVTANNSLLTGLRIDLTDDNLYTVSPGTRNVLASIVEPINVYLFFSDSETADIAPLRNYANRVREMLEELESAGGGNLVLHVIDPVPFSEDEDRAAQFGLQPITLGLGTIPVFPGSPRPTASATRRSSRSSTPTASAFSSTNWPG